MTPAISLQVVTAPQLLDDSFRCIHYQCVLTAQACVARQTAKRERKGAGNSGRHWVKTYVPLQLQYCASGACEQGKAIAAAVAPAPKERVA